MCVIRAHFAAVVKFADELSVSRRVGEQRITVPNVLFTC